MASTQAALGSKAESPREGGDCGDLPGTLALAVPREGEPRRRLGPVLAEAVALVLLVALSLPVVRPLFSSGLQRADDGTNHIMQLAVFASSLEHGNFYPRWTPLFSQQYGSPIFNYYAPLPFYVAELAHVAGGDIVGSLRIVFALGIVLSGIAMYFLVRDVAGSAAGFLSAVTYVALPYRLHDVYNRGALGETFALWLMPMAMYGFARYARCRQATWIALGALGLGGVIVTHNITAIMFTPFLALWIAMLAVQTSHSWPARGAQLARLSAGVALGIGLTTFFWLPALAEKGLVRLDPNLSFAWLQDSMKPQTWPPIDSSLVFNYRYDSQYQLPVHLGLVQVLLATAGVICLVVFAWRSRRRELLWLLAMIPAALAIIYLQTKQSIPIYRAVPLLAFVQFSQRLFAIFGIVSAFFTGFLVLITRHRSARWALALLFGCAALYTSLKPLRPDLAGGVPFPFDERALLLTEASMENLSGTATSEYTPRWVQAGVKDVISTAAGLNGVEPPMDSPSSQLSPAHVVVLQSRDTSMTLRVTSSARSRLLLHRFYMPAWRATSSDGRDLPVSPVGPLGLVGVDIPAGSSIIRLDYTLTAVERIAVAISLGCSALAVVWLAFKDRAWLMRFRLALAITALLLSAWLAVLAVRFAHIRQGQSGEAPLLSSLPAPLAPGYEIAGVDVDRSDLSTEGLLRLGLDIFTRRAGSDLTFHLRAVDAAGKVVATATERPWNGPTVDRASGQLARAQLDLPLIAGTFDGPLLVEVAAGSPSDREALTFVPLARIAGIPATPPAYHALFATYEHKFGIHGYLIDRPEDAGVVSLPAAANLDLTFDFQASTFVWENVKVFVHLVDARGVVRAQHDDLAGGIQHPAGSWSRGDFDRQGFPLKLPENAPTGDYRLEIGVYHPETLRRLALDPSVFAGPDNAILLATVVRVTAAHP